LLIGLEHFIDAGRRRANLKPCIELFQSLRFSFRPHLNTALRSIAHPARKPEPFRANHRGHAETDALDFTFYDRMEGFHGALRNLLWKMSL
jgi:hypothetical protein